MSAHAAALPYNIGVQSMSGELALSDLTAICGAIQKGLNQDFAPAWHVSAVVQAFPAGKITPGYWQVTVKDGIDAPGAAGYHDDDHRRPFAEVDLRAGDVSVTLDHEIKEMVADPWGARTWVYHTPSGERIHVLIEVCDPPEEVTEQIDGIKVSDFVLPSYYRHHKVQWVQRTHLSTPLEPVAGIGLGLALGGYVSWHDEQDHWHQATWFQGAAPAVRTLGDLSDKLEGGRRSPRSVIDELTREFRASLT